MLNNTDRVTVETIRQHLNSLGYDDIPEDIMRELAEELNESGIMESPSISSSFTASAVAAASYRHPQQVKQEKIVETDAILSDQKKDGKISKSEVISQLHALGYDEKSLPADVLDELVAELNESLNLNDQHKEDIKIPSKPLKKPADTPRKDQKSELSDFANVRQTVRNQRAQFQEDTFEEEDDYDARSQVSATQSVSTGRDVENSYHQGNNAYQQQRYQQQTQRRVKKNDPVSLYHRFKSSWDNDSFLQRLSNPAASKSKERMFGGIGYHAVMGGSRVMPPKKLSKAPAPPFA